MRNTRDTHATFQRVVIKTFTGHFMWPCLSLPSFLHTVFNKSQLPRYQLPLRKTKDPVSPRHHRELSDQMNKVN